MRETERRGKRYRDGGREGGREGACVEGGGGEIRGQTEVERDRKKKGGYLIQRAGRFTVKQIRVSVPVEHRLAYVLNNCL